MSLSTLRRRENSRARELTPDGRAPGEDQAQGARAPGRGAGEGRRLEIGGADRRLEALLEEERTRAASVPVAGVRRLRLEDGRDQTRALDDGGREAAGRGAQGGPIGTLDDGARAMGLASVKADRWRPWMIPGLEPWGLANFKSSPMKFPQQALGRTQPGPGLLDPLLQGNDQGAQRGGVLDDRGERSLLQSTPARVQAGHRPEVGRSGGCESADGLRAGGQVGGRTDIAPRVLDPYGTPGQNQGQQVNPFWSDAVRRGAMECAPGAGDQRGSPAGQVGVSGLTSGRDRNPVESPEDEVERLRARILREAEEAFGREVKKLGIYEKGDGDSYHTATSAGGGGGQSQVPRQPQADGPSLEPPPGLNHVKISDGAGDQVVSESLRHLELPGLPQVGAEGAALQFGDWLTIASPLMSDLGSSSKKWWEQTVRVAEEFYGRWLESTPLERLRLKPTVEVGPGYQGLEQRGISMLLGILPEALRRDIVGARNVSMVSILYRLFVVFQPGGGAERSALLKNLTDLKPGSSVADVLSSIIGYGDDGFPAQRNFV